MLRLEDVTLTIGTHDLLVGAELHVRPLDKIGLVGRNGAGKTSLLRLMMGELDPGHGKLHRRKNVAFGYLPQQAVSGSTRTVWDEAASGMSRVNGLRERLALAEAAVASGVDGAIDRLGDATEAFRIGGGYTAVEAIGEVLDGLGFGKDDWTRTCDTFSGGWQMRIALAKLLLSEPDLLVLDEPTNHLDVAARSWLARHLEGVSHGVVVVSHDRHLLGRVANRTVEIRHKRLHVFTGNLTAWLAERELRDAQAQAAFNTQQEEIAKLERFVDRFKAKATKAAQARSKQKALDRIDRVEAPECDARPRFRLPEAPGCSAEAVVLRGATTGWPEGPDVLTDVDLILTRGMRLALIGPNGCGKSTLLHALAGRLSLRAGKRKVGKDVRFGIYTQDLAADLPGEQEALEHVLSMAPATTPARARAAMGALGLAGDKALRPISSLSGGEKARVVLAGFALRPCNVLCLDEPTNHLDAMTVDVLVDALKLFEGALLIVSHDRFLVEQLATHVGRVEGGRLVVHEGVGPEDFEPRAVAAAAKATQQVSEGAMANVDRKERRRERTRLERRYKRIGDEVEGLENKMAALDAQLFETADYARAAELGAERTALEASLEALFEEWESIEAELAD